MVKKNIKILIILFLIVALSFNALAAESNVKSSVTLKGTQNNTNMKVGLKGTFKGNFELPENILENLEMYDDGCVTKEECEISEKIVEKEAPKGLGLFWEKIKLKFSRSPEVKFKGYTKIAMSHLVKAEKYYNKGEKEKTLKELELLKEQLKKADEYLKSLEEEYKNNPTKEKAKKLYSAKKSLDAFQDAITNAALKIQQSNMTSEEKQKILPLIKEVKEKVKLHKNNITKINLELKQKINFSDKERLELEEKYYSSYGKKVSSRAIIDKTWKEYERTQKLVEKIVSSLEGKNLTEKQKDDLETTIQLLNESKMLLEEAEKLYEEKKYDEAKSKALEAHKKIVEAIKTIAKYKEYVFKAVLELKVKPIEKPIILKPLNREEVKELREKKMEQLEEKLKERFKVRFKEKRERIKELREKKIKRHLDEERRSNNTGDNLKELAEQLVNKIQGENDSKNNKDNNDNNDNNMSFEEETNITGMMG